MATPTPTIASLPRISSTELSKAILESASSNLDAQTPPAKLAVVDVRDDDHIGGHIKNSIHAPSASLDHKIPELVRKLKDKDVVVFHCALSQQRGPSAALKYIRERDRLLGSDATTTSAVEEAMKKDKVEAGKREKRADGQGGGEEEEEEVVTEEKEEKKPRQKVYVLERGFVGWQERYGGDSRLTEGYRKEIWKDGYWM